MVEYRKPQERQPALEGIFLEKEGGVLRLRMGKGGSEYVYETDNVERMLQRAEEYFHAKEKYSWHVNQQVIPLPFSPSAISPRSTTSSEAPQPQQPPKSNSLLPPRRNKSPSRSTNKTSNPKTSRSTRSSSGPSSNAPKSSTNPQRQNPPPSPSQNNKKR